MVKNQSELSLNKVIANLSVHNPRLHVAYTGDLTPFSAGTAAVQRWSGERALSSYNIKLQTQTRQTWGLLR